MGWNGSNIAPSVIVADDKVRAGPHPSLEINQCAAEGTSPCSKRALQSAKSLACRAIPQPGMGIDYVKHAVVK